jgi:hypothetical protein
MNGKKKQSCKRPHLYSPAIDKAPHPSLSSPSLSGLYHVVALFTRKADDMMVAGWLSLLSLGCILFVLRTVTKPLNSHTLKMEFLPSKRSINSDGKKKFRHQIKYLEIQS